MFNKIIELKNFSSNKKNKSVLKNYKKLIFQFNEGNQLLKSLSPYYNYSFDRRQIRKYQKEKIFKMIGMGGSILGSEAIYSFLKDKIKKKFYFINNLQSYKKTIESKKNVNIIISKSGNTLETIANLNLYLNKKDKNIIITEKKSNNLNILAKKLKSEIIEHNNYIGGRYSVLSEVGMLPALLMGLDEKKFKQFNNLIKNKIFVKKLIHNVEQTLYFSKKKFNSIILNYDEKSEDLFKWYQQLIAESLGKKSKGFLPAISLMPKDNHSLAQLYLDGPKNNFYTFFSVKDNNHLKLNNKLLLPNNIYLYKKKINQIIYAQKKASEKVFYRKKIPFRSFTVNQRNEKTLGTLFCFFILETILLGRALNVNPFDQPSVELIKKETKKILY